MTYLPKKFPNFINSTTGNAVIAYGMPPGSNTLYAYIEFIGTGTISFKKSVTADILLVGGGGGGCATSTAAGGGGGAGGVVLVTGQTLNSGTTYTATIGAGGSGASTDTGGYNGGSTSFSSWTAYGGGGGSNSAGNYTNKAGPVGSGGGSIGGLATLQAPTAGQGNYGGYTIAGGAGGPWGYGTWALYGAGGGIANAPQDISSSGYASVCIGGGSSRYPDFDHYAPLPYTSMGYNYEYNVINKGSLDDPGWQNVTGVTTSVGTTFKSGTNLYYTYNKSTGYVSLRKSYAGGGGGMSGGSYSPGNSGGYGSGGNSGHDTWGDAQVNGTQGWGGTGGGGGGGRRGAGGNGGSGVCMIRFIVINTSLL
jgi:hypothetical protein